MFHMGKMYILRSPRKEYRKHESESESLGAFLPNRSPPGQSLARESVAMSHTHHTLLSESCVSHHGGAADIK